MAVQNKLNDKQVQAARVTPGKGESMLADGDRLYLRVRPAGKNWIFWYTSPTTHARRKLELGAYPTLSLSEAREKAAAPRKLLAAGIDPLEHRAQEALTRELISAPRTVQELFDRWKSDYLALHRADRGAHAACVMEKHALPVLGPLALASLRAGAITEALTRIKKAGATSHTPLLRTTAVVLSNLRQMCTYAVERDWLAGDPTAALKKKTWCGIAVKRERTLSEDEIRNLARKAPDAGLPAHIECALWIMLACATRVEETSLTRLRDLDLDRGTWLIPKENQKQVASGNKDFVVDLSPFALATWRRLIALQEAAALKRAARNKTPYKPVDHLFPARRQAGALHARAIAHALNDRQKPCVEPLPGRTPLVSALVLPGGKWTAHDLRRTAATLMRELGTPSDVVDRCQNHAESDAIKATYQRGELHAEMHDAWMKLGAKLEELSTPPG